MAGQVKAQQGRTVRIPDSATRSHTARGAMCDRGHSQREREKVRKKNLKSLCTKWKMVAYSGLWKNLSNLSWLQARGWEIRGVSSALPDLLLPSGAVVIPRSDAHQRPNKAIKQKEFTLMAGMWRLGGWRSPTPCQRPMSEVMCWSSGAVTLYFILHKSN